MTSKRQDAWLEEEDKLLAEIVLRIIKEGGTQLQAFEEVGRKLTRTAAACGFRWNSHVRKQYKAEIEVAKNIREKLKRGFIIDDSVIGENIEQVPVTEIKPEVEFDEVLQYLKDIYNKAFQYDKAFFKDKQSKSKDLEATIYNLIMENKNLESRLSNLKSSYQALVDLMEKAREMVVFDRRT